MTIIVYKLLLQTFKLFITYQIMSICKIPSFFLLNIFKTNVKLNFIFLEVKKSERIKLTEFNISMIYLLKTEMIIKKKKIFDLKRFLFLTTVEIYGYWS